MIEGGGGHGDIILHDTDGDDEYSAESTKEENAAVGCVSEGRREERSTTKEEESGRESGEEGITKIVEAGVGGEEIDARCPDEEGEERTQ